VCLSASTQPAHRFPVLFLPPPLPKKLCTGPSAALRERGRTGARRFLAGLAPHGQPHLVQAPSPGSPLRRRPPELREQPTRVRRHRAAPADKRTPPGLARDLGPGRSAAEPVSHPRFGEFSPPDARRKARFADGRRPSATATRARLSATRPRKPNFSASPRLARHVPPQAWGPPPLFSTGRPCLVGVRGAPNLGPPIRNRRPFGLKPEAVGCSIACPVVPDPLLCPALVSRPLVVQTLGGPGPLWFRHQRVEARTPDPAASHASTLHPYVPS